MNKSFRDRLAALEALEGPPAGSVLDNAPITSEDQELLYMAISTYRAILDERGYLARKEKPSAPDDLDRAISRCNAGLARLAPRLRTLEEVDGWIRQLEDPDTFDEDELFGWVHWGLAKEPPTEGIGHADLISFSSGELRVSVSFPGALRGHWTRIVERAAPLLKERGIVLFPLFSSDARAALALLDSGVLTCRPLTPNCWRSHNHTIQVPYPSSNELHALRTRLVWALDQAQLQTGGAFIETADDLRAALVSGLENSDNESIQETA
jgi:hypothetical protein